MGARSIQAGDEVRYDGKPYTVIRVLPKLERGPLMLVCQDAGMNYVYVQAGTVTRIEKGAQDE